MVHIFYGEDKNSMAYELHKLVQYYAFVPIQHIYFDNNHQQIIDCVYQIDLFNNEQVFVIHNATFLINSEIQDMELTQKLMHASNELYLIVIGKKDSFNKYAKGVDIKKISKFNNASKQALINNLLKSQNVRFDSNATQQEFENLTSNDPFMMENEINKLILISQNKIITKNMLDNAINDSTELNIFKLIKYLLINDKKSLIKLYDNLIVLKYQPIELIQVMSSQLFNLKLLKQAMMQHYSQTEIESQLKITKFMQFANYDILNKITIDKLNLTINELASLDYNIKHSLINPYLGLKLMLSK
ncbi:MAG: hypothetical protein LBF36_00715 [Mycoplasmataceae bacterium]|jgi:DNA polymerase-3 subunit delta|nr:hypothetical protein [Mycoplasmataceae bacterium]